MPDVTLSTDIDAFLKTADDAAARTELGLGSAAEAATGDFATASRRRHKQAQHCNQQTRVSSQSQTNGATTLNDIEVGRIVTAGNTLGPVATAVDALAIGGTGNSATGQQSEVLGGGGSSATGTGSTIVGGNASSNSGNWAIVAGGRNHNTAASRTGILGGEYANVTHADSSMLSVRGTPTVIKESQAAQTAHVDNLHIFEGGFKMPTGATDTYVLTTDATGVGTWQAAGGGGGGGGTVQNVNLSIEPTDEGTVAGNARGANAVDLQTFRTLATQVASGVQSVIGGGLRNSSVLDYNTVGGGNNNTASGLYGIGGATVSGGESNTASGAWSTVSGGVSNTASAYYSVVGGGKSNNATQFWCTISGGYGNTASGIGGSSTVVGGWQCTASGSYGDICGGFNSTSSGYSSVAFGDTGQAQGNFSVVSGGRNNTASGPYSAVLGGCEQRHEQTMQRQ